MSYRVKLNVFEGPFDLLVYLIEHAEMSIYDIQISEIVKQYMEHVEAMQITDVNVSSEFMVLAAALLEIKSKMLLPRAVPEEGSTEVAEDPRTELVAKLLEYKKFKRISEMLETCEERTAKILEKPQEDLAAYTGEPDEYLSLDIEKFKAAFEQFLRRKKKLEEIREHHRRSEKQRLTQERRMEDIQDFFRRDPERKADFRELIHQRDDKYDVAVTFSSVLEMMKQRRIDAEQQYLFGDITVTAAEELFSDGGDVSEESAKTFAEGVSETLADGGSTSSDGAGANSMEETEAGDFAEDDGENGSTSIAETETGSTGEREE